MARHRSFSFEFKRQVVLDFLEGRAELRALRASTQSLPASDPALD